MYKGCLMVRPARAAVCLSAVFLLAVLAGCGGRGPEALPPTYPAAGSVAYKGGRPMTGGAVLFVSAADPLLRVTGEVQKDGRFTLRTQKDGARADGAPEGEYRVEVLPPLVADPRGGVQAAHKGVAAIPLPRKYRVEPRDNTFQIELPVGPPR
jgi:hypothetical protein